MPYPPSRDDISFFRQNLMRWYDPDARPMPWKEERDPYLIWLSEVIMQQTRVAQGLPYFERFRDKYPDVYALASAPEDEIMKMWEGLGYYRRASHMREAARQIVEDSGGLFPNTYQGIKDLKGVGPYSAAAIASLAYGLPHAVVDGNVYRVLSRFFGIETPIDTGPGKGLFQILADELLHKRDPGRYNQAIMDFGATVCRPKNPICSSCALSKKCLAFHQGTQGNLPVKRPPAKKVSRYFHYLVMQFKGLSYIRKRTDAGIWRDLYEFPLVESEGPIADPEEVLRHETAISRIGQTNYSLRRRTSSFKQTLSHQIIHANFYEIDLKEPLLPSSDDLLEIPSKELGKYAFPRVIDWYLRDNSLTLNI